MRKEIEYFFLALQFFTRIPCSRWVRYSETGLNEATRYFPLIGLIVGGSTAGAYLICAQIFSSTLSILIALLFSTFLTGAFHEDGLADVFDGFGGGWEKDQILRIMKDSRLGTYGVLAVLFSQAIRIAAIAELPHELIPYALLSAHPLSRMISGSMIYFFPYVQEDRSSKAKPLATSMSLGSLYISALIGFCCPLFALGWQALLLATPSILLSLLLMRYFMRRIGGYTGDCLGAMQQVAEITFYLVLGAAR